MKNSIIKFCWVAVGVLYLAACTPTDKENTMDMGSSADHDHSLVELTPEQLKNAGIEVGLPVQKMISDMVECTGMVEVPPIGLASVHSPVGGFIQTVDHLVGSYVKKGEALTSLQHPELIRLQRDYLASGSKLNFLEKDYQRKKELAREDATSAKILEQAEADFKIEQAHFKGMRSELQLIGIRVDALEKDGVIQNELVLRSPINGYVSKVNVNKGKLVSPDELLFEIVDVQHVHVELKVFAKDLNQIKRGQKIECFLPGSSTSYPAEVHLVGHAIDPETKSTIIHGHFANEPVSIAPGTFMQARIFTDSRQALVVPESAVVREGAETYIFVKTGNGFEKMGIQTGTIFDGEVELVDTRAVEGKSIVLKGAYYLNHSGEAGH